MSGQRIKLAVEALKLFIHSIPFGSKFNIVSYGSNYVKMFQKSVEYDEESLSKALKALETFYANMGGTEILEPIKDVLEEGNLQGANELPRHIYLLTDGAVSNT